MVGCREYVTGVIVAIVGLYSLILPTDSHKGLNAMNLQGQRGLASISYNKHRT